MTSCNQDDDNDDLHQQVYTGDSQSTACSWQCASLLSSMSSFAGQKWMPKIPHVLLDSTCHLHSLFLMTWSTRVQSSEEATVKLIIYSHSRKLPKRWMKPFILTLLFISVTTEPMTSRPLYVSWPLINIFSTSPIWYVFCHYFFILKYLYTGTQDSSSSKFPIPTLSLGALLTSFACALGTLFPLLFFQVDFFLRRWSWELG